MDGLKINPMNRDDMQAKQLVQQSRTGAISFKISSPYQYRGPSASVSDLSIASHGKSKKRRAVTVPQEKPRKQRFHWGGNLHFEFIRQLYKYGLENIPTRKVFETMRQYCNDITYDFIENQLNDLRDNMEESLKEFYVHYYQALHYQESYSGSDAVISKFSLYPFAPQSVSQLTEEFQHVNISADKTSATPSATPPEESSTSDLLSRIAVPKVSFADLLPSNSFESSSSHREQIMDSQIELHQDMLFQNNYMQRKSIIDTPDHHLLFNGTTPSTPGFEFGITSSEDDMELGRTMEKQKIDRKRSAVEMSPTHLISSVLSAQNDRYVEHVDRLLAENSPILDGIPFDQTGNEVLGPNDSMLLPSLYDQDRLDDVFDFLK